MKYTAMIVFLAVIVNICPAFSSGMQSPGKNIRFISITDNAVVPFNWNHPVIEWEDGGGLSGEYLLTVQADAHKLVKKISGGRFVFKDDSFIPFLRDKQIQFVISHTARENTRSAAVTVTVDPSPFTDKVVYRLVEPLFNPQQNGMIRTLTLADSEPKIFSESKKTCIGCHSYRDSVAVLNTKRIKDRRFIVARSLSSDTFSQFRFGEFSFVSISPDSKYVALVRNSRSMIEIKKTFKEPFDMTYNAGDIEIFDTGTNEIKPLPGASDPDFVQDMPWWSPDGKSIIFIRYLPNIKENKLNPVQIYTITFNGGKGGNPKLLMSNPPSRYCFFPRFSPDGSFVSFVSGDASKGYFARSSSMIWIYSLRNGSLNSPALNMPGTMNSWHVWSTDSKWIVFSSKRNNKDLTALYLSRIDSNGTGHPAVEIGFDQKYKVNLPIIVSTKQEFDFGRNLSNYIDSIFK